MATVTKSKLSDRKIYGGSLDPVTIAGIDQAVTRALVQGGDYGVEVRLGNVEGYTVIHHNGRNDAIPASVYTPVNPAAVYRMPPTLTSLEILSSSADDDFTGTGARTILILGIGDDWIEQSEVVEMDGTTPVALANTYYRVFEVVVASTGTYLDQNTGSNNGIITLRESGGGQTWSIIDIITGYGGAGRSQMGAFTIPRNKTGMVYSVFSTAEANQQVSIGAFFRVDADEVVAPFGSAITRVKVGLIGADSYKPVTPVGFITPGPADIWMMAKANSGTAAVSIDFEIVLIDDVIDLS